MQSTPVGFTAEAKDTVRRPVASLQVAWKKALNPLVRFFTIGVSSVGGSDPIASAGGITSDWNNYLYQDESANLLSIDWERELNMPVGGISKALWDAELDNTSGRYTPRYMGGSSELFTAILPRRPVIINAGFNYNDIDNMIPQVVGINTKMPEIDIRNRLMRMQGSDFNEFLQNRYMDQTTMFTGLRTDEVIEDRLQELGYGTGQYELDPGIHTIPFGLFEKGTRYGDIINDLVQAEYGHFYQDEEGKLRFENRQHWYNSPHNSVAQVITTGDVIQALGPNEDHIINVVEVRANVKNKQPEQTVFRLNPFDAIRLNSGVNEIFVDFDDPILAMTTPTSTGETSFFLANVAEDGSGSDLTSSVSVTKVTKFAKSAKIEFNNSSSNVLFLTELTISGRPAKVEREIYVRNIDESSRTAFEERPLVIENDYILSDDWANSLSQLILSDFAEPENLQYLTIKAMPELQMGDLISWQGRYWRIFGIETQLDPALGFIQQLKLLQRTIIQYFTIGISSIGGSDPIGP